MGRPPIAEPADIRWQIRVTPTQKEKIERAAALTGERACTWARDAIMAAVSKLGIAV